MNLFRVEIISKNVAQQFANKHLKGDGLMFWWQVGELKSNELEVSSMKVERFVMRKNKQ